MKEVKLAPLEWGNFEVAPKLMKISNTGMTAVLSGKWQGPRPFLTRGPISGKYVFSQLHFHWGRSFSEGSEHRLQGQALPLEAHVMFFKNIYESQDDAMKKVDGTVTIAYFFKLQPEDNEKLDPIIDSLPHIVSPFSSHHMEKTPLKSFMPFFSGDYFMYWGNVYRMNVLWIISRQPLGISPKQLLLFKNLLDGNHKPIERNFRDPRDLNDRLVFYVNPSDYRTHILLPLPPIQISETPDESIFSNMSGALMGTLTGSAKVDDNEEGKYLIARSKSLLEENLPKKRSIMDILSDNLSKSPNMADFKYTLAKTLLELEEKENDDYGVLENYIKAKYASKVKKYQEEDVSKKFKSLGQEQGSGTIVRPIGFFGDEGGNNTQKPSKMNVIDEIYPTSNDECLEKKDESSSEKPYPILGGIDSNVKKENENLPSNIALPKVQFSTQPLLMQNTAENIYSNFNTEAEGENNTEETKPQSGVKDAIQNQIEKTSSKEKGMSLSETLSIDEILPALSEKLSNERSISLSRKSSIEQAASLSKRSSIEQSIPLSRRSSNDRSVDLIRSSNERGVSLSRRSSIEKSIPLSSKPSNERSTPFSNKPSKEMSLALPSIASHENIAPLSTTNERLMPLSKKVSHERTSSLTRKPSSLKLKKEAITNLSSATKTEEETNLQNKINKERTSSIPHYRRKSSAFIQQEKPVEKVSSNEIVSPTVRKLSSSEIRRKAIRRIFSNENNEAQPGMTGTQENTLGNKSSIEKTGPAIKKVNSSKIKEETEFLGQKISERNSQFAKKASKSSLQQPNQVQDGLEQRKSGSEIKGQNSLQSESINGKTLSPTRKINRAEIQKRIIEKKLMKEKMEPITPKTSHTEVGLTSVQRKQSSERSVYLTKKSSRPKIDQEFNTSVKSTIEKTIEINTKSSELKVQEQNISPKNEIYKEETVPESVIKNETQNFVTEITSNENTKVETSNYANTEQELNYFLVQVPAKSSNTAFQEDIKSNKEIGEETQPMNNVTCEIQDSIRTVEKTTDEETISTPLEKVLEAKVPENPCDESIPVSINESSNLAEDEPKKDVVEIPIEIHSQQSVQEKGYCESNNPPEVNEYYESNNEEMSAVSLTEDIINNTATEKILEVYEETITTDECDSKQLIAVGTKSCESNIENLDVDETSNDILTTKPSQEIGLSKKDSTTGIKRPSNFEKPSMEKDKLTRNDSHHKSVTFAQSPIVFDDSSEKEYNANSKQVNWAEDDKLSQMKKKLVKRMGKLKSDLKPEAKSLTQPEGPPSSLVKRSESPNTPGKTPAGNIKVNKEDVDIASVRLRVQMSLAKLNKERQEYQNRKGSDRQVWRP